MQGGATLQRYKLRLEFDGGNFLGWQWQAPDALGRKALQNVVEETLSVVLRTPQIRYPVQGSGRTDAGVHAEEYFAHVDLPSDLLEAQGGIEKFRHKCNGVFPDGLVITHLEHCTKNFHALQDIERKVYEYRILLRRAKPALTDKRVLWLPIDPQNEEDFNLAAFRETLRLFKGEHDFAAFASAGSPTQSTIRNIYRCELRHQDLFQNPNSGLLLCIEFEGSGFLKQMVRNLVGTALEVAQSKRSLENVQALLKPSQNKLERKNAGVCAEAWGLYLKRIHYKNEATKS